MDVVSTCPLRVACVVWQPRPGAWALTIVCKATYRLEPGVCALAEAQADPAEDDGRWDAQGSLRAPSDLVPFKARADVLLVGHAFAPGGQPARTLLARLAVGAIDKSVEVWCDRIFWHDGQLLEGQPFTQMPLRYERAAGGPGTWNPVGSRLDAPPDARGGARIPNLQPPGLRVARRGDTFGPIGFGPIAPEWPGRVEKLRGHAEGWSHRAWRDKPLPGDLDAAYFNAAPRDQQVDAIEADEQIALSNLHPEHAQLSTKLPGVRPSARMTAGGRAGEGVALSADTLWIDTDEKLVTVVWRGRLPLIHPGEAGRVVVSMEQPGSAAPEVGGTLEVGPGEGRRGADMPFAAASGEIGTILGGRAERPALPFGPAKSPWASPAASAPAIKEPPVPAETGTVFGVRLPGREVLPFVPDAPPAAPPVPSLATTPLPVVPLAVPVAEVVTEARPEPVHEAAEPEVAAPAPPPEPAAAPSLPLDDFPIERCAAIAASIARRRERTAEILEQNELSRERWDELVKQWQYAIREQTTRGTMDLLRAYDAAYVAELEAERGSISVEEYARLMIASERGAAPAVLDQLGLPAGVIIRLQRVWGQRMMADAALGREVRAALEAASKR